VPHTKLSYRPEIDGLRAVAVLSVILYHARISRFGLDWFEGGYIGVDIFFVLSGYLITRIILSELYDTSSFSFSGFYEKRARRILPMLFLVIFASIPFAWLILLPHEITEYAESILASIFFGSNFFFYFSTTEYGADSSLLKPFLHTWSLGVEEQFYLVFPVLAIVVFRFLKDRLFTVLLLVTLASLLFSEAMESRYPDLNFYLPFSRFWELSAGSILAYRELNAVVFLRASVSRFLPLIGLCLISYSILFFDGDTPHPGFRTLIPVIGIALIIGFASKAELVGRVLSLRPLVGIGLISYSAYLWHYPIFAFSRIMNGDVTNADKAGWILLTFALSVASYFVVEKPVRTKEFVRAKLFLGCILFSACSLVTLGVIALAKNGLPDRLPPILAKTSPGQPPWFVLRNPENGEPCHQSGTSCYFPSADPEKDLKIVILGDSDAASAAMTLVPRFNNKNMSVLVNTEGVCPFYLGGDLSPESAVRNAYYRKECSQEFQRKRLSEIKNFAPSMILHMGRLHQLALGSNISNPSEDLAGIKNLTRKHLVLLGQHHLEEIAPTLYVKSLPGVPSSYGAPVDHVRRLIRRERDASVIKARLDQNPHEFEPLPRQIADWKELGDLLGAQKVFDTWHYVCDSANGPEKCSGADVNGIFYFDSAHPSEYLIDRLYKDLEEAVLVSVKSGVINE